MRLYCDTSGLLCKEGLCFLLINVCVVLTTTFLKGPFLFFFLCYPAQSVQTSTQARYVKLMLKHCERVEVSVRWFTQITYVATFLRCPGNASPVYYVLRVPVYLQSFPRLVMEQKTQGQF